MSCFPLMSSLQLFDRLYPGFHTRAHPHTKKANSSPVLFSTLITEWHQGDLKWCDLSNSFFLITLFNSYSIFFKSVCRKIFVHRHRTFSNELVSWHPWTRVERGLNALIKKGMMAKFMFLRTHALFYGEELHCCDIGMTWHSMVIFHFQFELLFLTWPMPRFY